MNYYNEYLSKNFKAREAIVSGRVIGIETFAGDISLFSLSVSFTSWNILDHEMVSDNVILFQRIDHKDYYFSFYYIELIFMKYYNGFLEENTEIRKKIVDKQIVGIMNSPIVGLCAFIESDSPFNWPISFRELRAGAVILFQRVSILHSRFVVY